MAAKEPLSKGKPEERLAVDKGRGRPTADGRNSAFLEHFESEKSYLTELKYERTFRIHFL